MQLMLMSLVKDTFVLNSQLYWIFISKMTINLKYFIYQHTLRHINIVIVSIELFRYNRNVVAIYIEL